ncbi:unnamed protein product [Nyctereutes procyonoides]|uniref:(raccoon dog) hypothetical protein n=1 Tax=Nyctereutes procyonoides TaxID=34880 RepID=A0A811YB05_NYCPR|nr:unnamed protein product [Nyctereutes procyonoides]
MGPSGWPSQSRRATRGPPREGANAERLRSSVGLATRPRRPPGRPLGSDRGRRSSRGGFPKVCAAKGSVYSGARVCGDGEHQLQSSGEGLRLFRNGILNQSIWNHLVSTNEQITNSTTYVGSSFLFLLKHGTVIRGIRIVHLSIARYTRILGLEEI